MRKSAGKPPEIVNIFFHRRTADEPEEYLGIVERRVDGRVSIRRAAPEYSCFLRASDISRDLRRRLESDRNVKGTTDEGDWIRFRWRDRFVRERVCAPISDDERRPSGYFARLGIPVYEGDVDPVRLYLTDRPEVAIARPRRVYLDIETDSRVGLARKEQARLLAFSLVDEKGDVVRSAVLARDTDEAEKALLSEMFDGLDAFDQVIAWNGGEPSGSAGFDFPVIRARVRARQINVELDRWLWLDQMRVFQRSNMSAAESGDEKQSLALDAVARSLGLGGKLDGVSGAQSWDLWVNDRELLLRYCEHDTLLQQRIEAKTGYVELLLTLCQATHTFPDTHGIKPTRQVEGFLLRLGRERGIRFPTHYHAENPGKYEGAYVQEPTCSGVTRNVHVCDFARLYPSVILSFNLSTETVRGRRAADDESPIPEGHAIVPLTNVLVAQEPRGVLCEALETALVLRKAWDKKKAAATPGTDEWKEADRRSSAYKIFANSFYGVVGSPYSRFFLRDVAESTSLGGVWLIKETIAAATARGWEVVYGDTDSAFVVGPSEEDFSEFVAWCNAELYPQLLRGRGAARNHVSLAYEKAFRALVMVSKKRYAGAMLHYKGTRATADSKLEVKGLEYKRGDTSRLARRLQLEIVETILRAGDHDPATYEAMLDRHREHVLKGELPIEDVTISKRLTKEIAEYAVRTKKDGERAEQATHVEVARVLQQRGEEAREGDRIEFVVVDGGIAPIKAIPARDRDPSKDDKREDRFYLWEQLVFPPAQRVLQAAFPGHDWSRWERVRPPRPRRRGRPVPEEQTTLPGFDTAPIQEMTPERFTKLFG